MRKLLLCFLLLAAPAVAQHTVSVNSNGVVVAPALEAFRASNDLAQASVMLTRATIAQLVATSAADRAYADGLTDPNALTNGVGSGCTVTSTGKTFYVYVVAPTGTAASVDVDLQGHKTNPVAHVELFAGKLDIAGTNGFVDASITNGLTPDDVSWRASTQTWNTVTNKADTATLASYVQTNDSRLTDNRTDGAAWHYGDSVTGAVDSVARGLTNYDEYGSALAVSNSMTNAVALALTALQAETDTLQTASERGRVLSNGVVRGTGRVLIELASESSFNFPEIMFRRATVSTNILTSLASWFSRSDSDGAWQIFDAENFLAGTHYLAPNGSGSNLTGITAGQVGAMAIGATASNVTTAAIVAAGAVTNWPYDPVLTQSNINSCLVNGTATLTRTMGNCLILATNTALTITADATLTAATVPSIFWLDLFAGTNQVTWITTAITNASTTSLSTTATNNLIFVKGTGATVIQGKLQ